MAKDMIGRIIQSKYKVYDAVGAGAFATVYLGRNMETNEIVAVKVLSPQFTQDSHYVERFRREAQLAEQLQHPNIVRVLDHGIEDGLHYLVMEFVEGLTLRKVIKRKGPLSIAETIAYAKQVCAGLQAAFEVGIVHRDIKSSNLMITPDGTVKIMDFGIARTQSMTGLTQTGKFVGTPSYIAPEVARGIRADTRSDLYAVGLLTYEMLAGAPPFDGASFWAILRMQIERDPPPISQSRSDVPPWLEAIMLKAVAKDPTHRFQTPAEMLAALRERTARPSRVPAMPPPRSPGAIPPPRAPAPGQRASKGLVLGLAVAAIVVALGLLVLLVFALRQGDTSADPTATPAMAQASTDAPGAQPTLTPIIVIVTGIPTETVHPLTGEPAATEPSPLPADTPSLVPSHTASAVPTYTPELTAPPTPVPSTPVPTTQGPTLTPPPTSTPQPSDTPTSPPAPPVTGRIAFSTGGRLHIVDAATGQDTVSPIPGMRQPDFRADGQLIIANGEGAGKDNLWTINANTGAFDREQTSHPDDYHPFWSPDGGRFAYDSLHHGLVRRGPMLYKQGMTNRGRPQPEVTLGHSGEQIRGTFPVWMHNDWIAFTGCDYWPGGTGGSRCGIYRMPSWGGEPALVHPGSLTLRATDNHASQLVYMDQETGNWEVYIKPAQGGEGRNLSSSPGSQDGLGTFSPDGKWVAFVSNREGWSVWIVRPDGSGLEKLFGLPEPLTGVWTEEQLSWGP
jgi:serine/threonine-protein kinase